MQLLTHIMSNIRKIRLASNKIDIFHIIYLFFWYNLEMVNSRQSKKRNNITFMYNKSHKKIYTGYRLSFSLALPMIFKFEALSV